MKKKDLKEAGKKELKELESMLSKKKLELQKVQVKILSGKEKNIKKAKNTKKEIAQLLTLISYKKKALEIKNKENPVKQEVENKKKESKKEKGKESK